MIDKNRIIELANQFFEGKNLFFTDVRVKPINKITVLIDGDEGVGIDECVALSRHIESNLDRETEDFELTVTTAGVGEPLRFTRQYVKNIGRTLQFKLTNDEIIEGQLTHANSDTITIERVVVEKINNKNVKRTDVRTIPYAEINEAVVMISFK